MIDRETSASQIDSSNVAQKCPVCNGWGTVSFKKITCHACKGKGFIVVLRKIEREKGYDKNP